MNEETSGDLKFDNSTIEKAFPVELPDSETITFECERVILNPNEVLVDYPDGLPLDFEKFKTLVFNSKEKKVTYKLVNVEEK